MTLPKATMGTNTGGGGGTTQQKKQQKKKPGGGGGGGSRTQGWSIRDLFDMGLNLSNPRQQARIDTRLLYQPQIHGLKRDYKTYANQTGALYDILQRQLGEAGAPALGNYQNINDAYTKGTQGIIDSLGQTTAPDQAAFLNTLGAQALAGSDQMKTMAANEQRYGASMGREAGLENMVLQRNAAGDLKDAMGQLRTSRATDFRDRLDQLRQTAFERMLALKEFQLRSAAVGSQLKGDKATRDFYSQLFGQDFNGNGGGGGGFKPRAGLRGLLGEGDVGDLSKKQRRKTRRYVGNNADALRASLQEAGPRTPDTSNMGPRELMQLLGNMNLDPAQIRQILQGMG